MGESIIKRKGDWTKSSRGVRWQEIHSNYPRFQAESKPQADSFRKLVTRCKICKYCKTVSRRFMRAVVYSESCLHFSLAGHHRSSKVPSIIAPFFAFPYILPLQRERSYRTLRIAWLETWYQFNSSKSRKHLFSFLHQDSTSDSLVNWSSWYLCAR